LMEDLRRKPRGRENDVPRARRVRGGEPHAFGNGGTNKGTGHRRLRWPGGRKRRGFPASARSRRADTAIAI